ncbi:MAG: caspase family protein [Saprospiraceae bacterium]|uniref:Caspase family protein n=1 Tax=Candidatus Defluviibacterium haderslevense TaxID=2981993 RepID=A0A9D7XEU9_9BACT|nr:caspase family protein [Candidatus Defluviibacterium haderslevense]
MSNKFALIVGINKYEHFPCLDKCENDCNDMNEFLIKSGFDCKIILNSSQTELIHELSNFKSRVKQGDLSLIYFSGHGLQDDKYNYVVCSDSHVQILEEIKYNCICVDDFVLDNKGDNLHIIILDACRNNPFHDGRKSIKFGLRKILAPHGTIIAFSTSPNSVSIEKRSDRNGIFTKHLLNNMAKPNTPIELVFKFTRNEVMSETSRKQIPWEESSLSGDNFSFVIEDVIDSVVKKICKTFCEGIENINLPTVLPILLDSPNTKITISEHQLFISLFEICGQLEWLNVMEKTLDTDYITQLSIDEFNSTFKARLITFSEEELDEFNLNILNQIELLRNKNYGFNELIELDEFFETFYLNEIRLDGDIGILSCFLTTSEDGQYLLKPMIALQTEPITFYEYKSIKGKGVNEFMELYLSIRDKYVNSTPNPIWDIIIDDADKKE